MNFHRIRVIGLASTVLVTLIACCQREFDGVEMKAYAAQLKEKSPFRYPLDGYFPETPVTDADSPNTQRKEKHHTGEDSSIPPGTPVYDIGDGIISYSGKANGYGWLIIIDHPAENVYSLYGHLSTSRWEKGPGEVKNGELIAYLGKAEEAETMHSHIHFVLMVGVEQSCVGGKK